MPELDHSAGLRQIVADAREWVALARVDAVAAHPSWGYLLDVTLQPRNVRAQARMLYLGSGDGQGVGLPVSVGDEVLLVLPGGDPNQAIAVGGLPSRPRTMPVEWENDAIRVDGGDAYDVEVRAGGTVVRVEAGTGDVRIEAAGDVYVDAATTIRAGGEAAVALVKLADMQATFDNHGHPTPNGPSGPPVDVATQQPLTLPDSAGTTKLKGE